MAATIRLRGTLPQSLLSIPADQPVIFCIWHNRLSLSLVIYRYYVRQQRRLHQMAALVSASRDGGILARILQHFRVQPVRGSSSRRGPQALLELTTWAERGYDLAITPDGPRGPRYVIQSGIVSLAQVTGLPIIPVSYRLNWKLQSHSWDRFQVPLPLSRCDFQVGEPLHVPRAASEPEREQLRLELENRMRHLTSD
jgi:lysophospholipid acyltransferase (LPLAT)-like uncharacterized protein